MTRFNPEIHHRRSIRLQNYDYSQNGAYFVTICVNKKQELLGNIENGEMIPNDAGLMVENILCSMPDYNSGVIIDSHVIMPNHIHAVIVINVGAPHRGRLDNDDLGEDSASPVRRDLRLGEIIARFKTLTTNKYIHGVNENGWEPFYQKLWLRNYHERVIRNESDLENIRKYIVNNPANWENDENYLSVGAPHRGRPDKDGDILGEDSASPLRNNGKLE